MNNLENFTTHVLNIEEGIHVKRVEKKELPTKATPIRVAKTINTNWTDNQKVAPPKAKTNPNLTTTPILMFSRKENLNTKRQKLTIEGNTPLAKLSDIEELTVRIEHLIAIREKLKKQYSRNVLTTPSYIKSETWDEKFLHKLSSYIINNIANPELNVTSIMCQMHMSRTQLHRKIKALTGFSTTEFIRTIRLKRAAQLLKQKTDSVTQIGYQIGFSDHSYFAKCFKKEYGMSPSEYSRITMVS